MQRVKRWLAVFFLVPFLQGCSDPPQPPLTFAANNWPGYYPIFLAKKLGYVDPQELNITRQVSASEVLRHLHAGTIDIGAVTLDEALLLLEHELAVKVILVADFSAGADAIVAQPSIQGLDDLRGKRIGVEKTALGAFVLGRALGTTNIHLNEVKTISLEFSEHYSAFARNEVDAVVTFEPVLSKLTARNGHVIFDSTQIPGEIVDVIVVRDDVINENPERLSSFVGAWFRGLMYMRDNQKKAYKLIGQQDLSYDKFQQALLGLHLPDHSENIKLFSNKADRLENVRKQLVLSMLHARLLRNDVSKIPLFDGRFVMDAAQ